MPEQQLTIAVDFDGTICESSGPPDYEISGPNELVIEALRQLKRQDWRIIVYSCRVNEDWTEQDRRAKVSAMLSALDRYEVPYDSVWRLKLKALAGGTPCQPEEGYFYHTGLADGSILTWSFAGGYGKPLAHVYLDDRAVNPTGVGHSVEGIVIACCQLAGYGCDRKD